MEKKLFNISFVVIIFFSVVGIILTGNIIHELSHKQDYKGLIKEDDSCALVIPESKEDLLGKIAFYRFYTKDDEESIEKAEEVTKWTEKKAYTIESILFIVFLFCIYFVFKKWGNMNKNSKKDNLK